MLFYTHYIVKDSNDDYGYEPDEDEEVASDTVFSDTSDDEIEARWVNEWTYVTDTFSDLRKTPFMEF